MLHNPFQRNWNNPDEDYLTGIWEKDVESFESPKMINVEHLDERSVLGKECANCNLELLSHSVEVISFYDKDEPKIKFSCILKTEEGDMIHMISTSAYKKCKPTKNLDLPNFN